VIGPAQPACPDAPKGWSEDDYRQQKEDAYYFKPQNAADAGKGPQKAAYATREPLGSLAGRTALRGR
jgi:hypothetical protein